MSQYWFNRCRTFHILTITTDLTSPSETFDISPKVTRRLSVSSYHMETCEAFGAPLQGHTDKVRCVAISPDGKRIVSGSTIRERAH
ncbi:hypothetical protein P692DRAFT_20724348 [Suillus brevipes Sb2]|nr:hypothetical protein P692DRAFT_20724348 [Suillus brevipes Sb2]